MVEKVHIDPPLAYGVAQCTVRTMRTRSHPRSGTHHGMQNPRVLLGACMLKGQRQSWTQHDRTRNVDDRMCSPCSPCSAISMRDFPAPFAEPRPNGRLAVLLPPSRSPLSVASDGKSAGGRVASRPWSPQAGRERNESEVWPQAALAEMVGLRVYFGSFTSRGWRSSRPSVLTDQTNPRAQRGLTKMW